MFEIRFGVQEDGSVKIEMGAPQKATRSNKGKNLLLEVSDFVSLDIETTGLSPAYDEIIDLAAVKYRNGVLVDSFSSLVKPEYPVDPFITQMTGITNEMLKDAPSLKEILPKYLEFLGEDVLVGHNVNFDINFIYDACEALGLPVFSNDFIDTMRLGRRMYKGLPNHKLDTLIDHFHLERRSLHRGLGDCELTAACYQCMLADKEAFEEAIKAKVSQRKHPQVKTSLKELIAQEGQENPDSPLFGKVCVFTGALESFTRKEAAQLVVNIGGICGDNITKKTNFLILGNNDYCKSIKDGKSGKQKKAEKLIAEGADLAIIPESVFLDLLFEDAGEPEEQVEAEVVKPNADELEHQTFVAMAPTLKQCLVDDNLSADYLFFRQSKTSNTQYSSVYLFNENSVFCRISFRGKQNYIAIPSKFENYIPSGVEVKKLNSDPNFCRIAIKAPEDIVHLMELMKKILDSLVESYPCDFGCCSRYEECSNALKCIHPNPDMAIRCIYRKNLKKGKVFYGKNKTV